MKPLPQMRLGLFAYLTGHHIASWRHPDCPLDPGRDVRHLMQLVQIAERGKFDAFFMADGSAVPAMDPALLCRSNRAVFPEPSTILAALSQVTSRIGLVATSNTTHDQPFHIAHKFMSLDHVSGGRAAWNLVTGVNPNEAMNYSRPAQMAHADRYARAREFAHVVLGLWDSWEDDALLIDKEAGRYYDAAKVRTLQHRGRFFQVEGALPMPPSPQGRPVLVQAGGSEPGRELAAETAEMIYSVQQDLGEAQEFYKDVKGRMAKYGREPDDLKIMPGMFPIVGRTREEAEDKYQQLQSLVDPTLAYAALAAVMPGLDKAKHPPNGKVPTDLVSNAGTTHLKILTEIAITSNLTIQQLALEFAGGYGHWAIRGTAVDIADQMEARFRAGACDGFNVMPATLPGGITDFVEMVVPELQRRGLFRTEYEGKTLRDHLGLKRPRRFVVDEAARTAA